MKKGRFDLYIREDFVEIKNLVSTFTSVMLQISKISLTKSLWSEYVKISYRKMCTVERKRLGIKCPRLPTHLHIVLSGKIILLSNFVY